MKRRNLAFFALAAALLSVVPAYNVLRARGEAPVRWTDRAFLFNVDMVPAWVSRVLLPLGISAVPDEVVIGRDRWLFLGDAHQSSLSVDRAPRVPADDEKAARIVAAMSAWDAFARARGVKAFRLMFAPNKGTVYPEYMPGWARPASPSGYDALFDADRGARFIDLRPALRAAKSTSSLPLYYATDTHWNFLGAGVAFQAFARAMAPEMPGVRWPGPEAYAVARVDRRAGGDLARFLRIPEAFDDPEPILALIARPLDTTRSDVATGQVVGQGGNPMIDTPQRPLLVRSPGALNTARVLWVRDSFGQALSPMMAATFSDVLQIGTAYALGNDLLLARLIEEWKPDYVVFTVVERLSREEMMARMPPGGAAVAPAATASATAASSAPPAAATATPVAASALRPGAPARVFSSQHLTALPGEARYRVTGNDPYLDFAFAEPVALAPGSGLRLALNCDDGTRTVPVQLFWLLDGMEYFDEASSLRMPLPTGERVLDLAAVTAAADGRRLRRVRIDTDAGSACAVRGFPPPVPVARAATPGT